MCACASGPPLPVAKSLSFKAVPKCTRLSQHQGLRLPPEPHAMPNDWRVHSSLMRVNVFLSFFPFLSFVVCLRRTSTRERAMRRAVCVERSCSMLSAIWFKPEHRATATAVAYMGGNLGSGLGFLLGKQPWACTRTRTRARTRTRTRTRAHSHARTRTRARTRMLIRMLTRTALCAEMRPPPPVMDRVCIQRPARHRQHGRSNAVAA